MLVQCSQSESDTAMPNPFVTVRFKLTSKSAFGITVRLEVMEGKLMSHLTSEADRLAFRATRGTSTTSLKAGIGQ